MSDPDIRPQTRVLDELIQSTIAQAEAGTSDPQSDTLLFLGNRHASFPALVIQDPILEPVDKLVWMTIALKASDAGTHTAFPSYEYISKIANIGSKSTIARTIAILRATRWLTLCARVRTQRGRFRGNVFALHDEPLPLTDALHLDEGYMQFLGDAQTHIHARVRQVANGVLETIDEDIHAGRDVCVQPHPLVSRIEATKAVHNNKPQRFFAFNATVMSRLHNQMPPKEGVTHQVRNSNLDNHRVRYSNSGRGSSSFIYKTTTTTPQGVSSNIELTGENQVPLVYPKRLLDNQRDVANRYLKTVPADRRQAILDELEGRFRAEDKGMRPLFDELSYLNHLCKALKNGEFDLKLGICVSEERRVRARADRQRQRSSGNKTNLQGLRNQISGGKRPIEAMRKILGIPPRIDPDDSNKKN